MNLRKLHDEENPSITHNKLAKMIKDLRNFNNRETIVLKRMSKPSNIVYFMNMVYKRDKS